MAKKIKANTPDGSEPRSFDEIIDELFFGRDAALENFSKVRHTQYEMRLWKKGLYADKKAMRHFKDSFLNGVSLKEANDQQISNAFRSLKFAVGMGLDSPTGCYRKCLRLVNELNEAIVNEKLGRTVDVEKFLNFFTFDHGEPVLEKPEMVETYPAFYDEKNRREFRATIKYLREIHRKMNPRMILSMIQNVKKHSFEG